MMTDTDTTQNVPKLRFPEFQGHWHRAPLHNYLQETKLRNRDLEFKRHDVLSVSGEFGCVNQIAFKGRSFAGASLENYHILRHGEIVYTKSPLANNPFGIIKANRGVDGIVSTLYAVYRVSEKANYKFLDHYFSLADNVNKYLRPIVRKGAKNDMKVNNLAVIGDTVVFPSIEEQNKIAIYLDIVDRKIVFLEQKRTLWEQYKKGCMQQIFSHQIRFKADDGSNFPDWEEKRIGDLGKTFGGLTGKSANDFGSGERFITYVQVFKASRIYPEQCGLVEVSKDERQNKIRLGDIIFTTSSETPGEVGFASVVTVDMPDTYLNSFCFALRPNGTQELVPEFSRYLFRSEEYRNKVIPLAQGSTRYNLSKSSFTKLRLYLPSTNEQQKIADFLSAIDTKIDLISQEISHAKAFKKGLLQQMFV